MQVFVARNLVQIQGGVAPHTHPVALLGGEDHLTARTQPEGLRCGLQTGDDGVARVVRSQIA